MIIRKLIEPLTATGGGGFLLFSIHYKQKVCATKKEFIKIIVFYTLNLRFFAQSFVFALFAVNGSALGGRLNTLAVPLCQTPN